MNLLRKELLIVLLLLPAPLCYAEPATPGTVLTFYITDSNLSTDHRAVMTMSTAGLVDFAIDGIPISGPGEMVETGVDTGTFQVHLTLPDSVNGKPLKDGDVVVMTYHQGADYSENPTTVAQSKVLSSTPPSPVSGSSSHVRIGQYFTLRIYAPNYNLDSFTPDDIQLDMIEFHMGGVQTTLADGSFQANPNVMRETGPNTDTFAVSIKIPKTVGGYPVEMGSTLEFRFEDHSMPSSVFVTVGGALPSPSYDSGTVMHMAPHSLLFYATSSVGAVVNYINSTLLSGLQEPACSPASGSFFMTGSTTVTCAAKDHDGNSVVKTFTINVVAGQSKIPTWTKKTVGFWCSGDVSDSQLSSGIKYLVSHGLMSVQADSVSGQAPDKTALCMWADGRASDQDVAKYLLLFSK